MKQYLELAQMVLKEGTTKPAAREGMPETISIFGHQNRYKLLDGFPIVTTKEISFKNIFNELRWFLRGETNVQFLVDCGCNIWNEDAYNYYVKLCKEDGLRQVYNYKSFVDVLKNKKVIEIPLPKDYKLGDCGRQYGWLWRNWDGCTVDDRDNTDTNYKKVDQLLNLIEGLIINPYGRRHLLTAWNPMTLNDMALNACHIVAQFNCRPISEEEKLKLIPEGTPPQMHSIILANIPDMYLDCEMYQRSGDLFLGVPYNISSYAALTSLIANLLHMVPGDFIHSFGDVHIYKNHISQINQQLNNKPYKLPKLKFSEGLENIIIRLRTDTMSDIMRTQLVTEILSSLEEDDLQLLEYKHHPKIEGKLSTGLN